MQDISNTKKIEPKSGSGSPVLKETSCSTIMFKMHRFFRRKNKQWQHRYFFSGWNYKMRKILFETPSGEINTRWHFKSFPRTLGHLETEWIQKIVISKIILSLQYHPWNNKYCSWKRMNTKNCYLIKRYYPWNNALQWLQWLQWLLSWKQNEYT